MAAILSRPQCVFGVWLGEHTHNQLAEKLLNYWMYESKLEIAWLHLWKESSRVFCHIWLEEILQTKNGIIVLWNIKMYVNIYK